MKILCVDVDGLLIEDYRAVPNCDPLAHGVAFFKRLMTVESVLLITRADLTTFAPWTTTFGITYTWLLNPDKHESPVTTAQSFAGRNHSAVALFATAEHSDALEASMRGVPATCFFHPHEENFMEVTPGSGWFQTGYVQVPEHVERSERPLAAAV